MLRKIKIENFRCLRDVEIELGPLTTFVGPNASGKSSLLEVIAAPNAYPTPVLPNPRDVWRHDSGLQIQISPTLDAPTYRGRVLCLDLQRLRQPNSVKRAVFLERDGANLANVFDTFTRLQQARLAEELCRLVPVFGDVDVVPSDLEGCHELCFQDRWDSSVWYTAHEVSDGTMLLLAFLTLQYAETPPDLVAIEEPERGLHPFLLGQLVDFLRRLATGEIGPKPIQVVMATHSAELLDVLQPDEVRFLTRDSQDGSVRVEKAPTESPDWEEAFQKYRESLGSAWLSGGLGGV